MLEPKKKMYDKAGPRVAAALQKRNMEAYYCPTAAEAVEKVLELIPAGDVVSWGGVATVDELGIKGRLRSRNQPVIDRDTARTPEERTAMLHQALTCDTFLMSSNAISDPLSSHELRRSFRTDSRPAQSHIPPRCRPFGRSKQVSHTQNC